MAMIDKNDEVFIAFVEESREHLLTLEEDILGLESDGKSVDDDLVNKVFRVAHSIKGTAAFLALDKIKDVAHAMESLLGLFRDHVLTPDAQLTTLLLQGADHLKSIIGDFDTMDAVDTSATVAALREVVASATSEETATVSPTQPAPAAEEVAMPAESEPKSDEGSTAATEEATPVQTVQKQLRSRRRPRDARRPTPPRTKAPACGSA